MNQSLLRTLLLILLSLTLPLQAAVAASRGGCLRHMQDGPGSASPAGVAGLGHRHGNNYHASPAQHSAQPPLAMAGHRANASPVGDAPCPHHQAADAPVASPEPDCNSCDWCCMGTALPSQALRWPASLAQPVPAAERAWAYVSPPLRALERPPRALLSGA